MLNVDAKRKLFYLLATFAFVIAIKVSTLNFVS